jgi:putative DNA primase/helicase
MDGFVQAQEITKRAGRSTVSAAHQPFGSAEQLLMPATLDDAPDYHRNAPRGNLTMLYGLAGDIGREAAKGTEANQYAATMNFLTFLAANVGRNVYLRIGNVVHHLNLFSLHVGRSSTGRKGDARALLNRIQHEIHRMYAATGDHNLLALSHSGGLSSREGLAFLIHDGYREGTIEHPPVTDKRLLVVESEFANVLHQTRRDGNTLSAALRDAWDGLGIKPATKTARLWASDPHIAIAAACTPTELRDMMQARELANGFANRFIIFWAERENLVPFPQAAPDKLVADLARLAVEVIQFAKRDYRWDSDPALARQDQVEICLAPKAKAEYERLYGVLNHQRDGELINGLMARSAPMLLRMASLFALTDLQTTVDLQHIQAAFAWVQYWRESVKFIFNNAAEESTQREVESIAAKILAWLNEYGQKSRTEISQQCLSGHVSRTRLDVALDSLLTSTPPAIEIIEGPILGNGKATKHYAPLHPCEIGEFGETRPPELVAANSRCREVGESGLRKTGGNLEASNPTSPSSQCCEVAAPRASSGASPDSPNSQAYFETQVRSSPAPIRAEPDYEVF